MFVEDYDYDKQAKLVSRVISRACEKLRVWCLTAEKPGSSLFLYIPKLLSERFCQIQYEPRRRCHSIFRTPSHLPIGLASIQLSRIDDAKEPNFKAVFHASRDNAANLFEDKREDSMGGGGEESLLYGEYDSRRDGSGLETLSPSNASNSSSGTNSQGLAVSQNVSGIIDWINILERSLQSCRLTAEESTDLLTAFGPSIEYSNGLLKLLSQSKFESVEDYHYWRFMTSFHLSKLFNGRCEYLTMRLTTADCLHALLYHNPTALFEYMRPLLQKVGGDDDQRNNNSVLFDIPGSNNNSSSSTTWYLWRSWRSVGAGIWASDQTVAKAIAAALAAAAFREKRREDSLLWACLSGMSPSAVLRWQKSLWKDPKQISLLGGSWTDEETRQVATRAALAHRECGEWKYAAALLIWSGDVTSAIRDCLLKSGHGGDAQLAILAATSLGNDSALEEILRVIKEDVAPGDPWLQHCIDIRLYSLSGYNAVKDDRSLSFSDPTSQTSQVMDDILLCGDSPGLIEIKTIGSLEMLSSDSRRL